MIVQDRFPPEVKRRVLARLHRNYCLKMAGSGARGAQRILLDVLAIQLQKLCRFPKWGVQTICPC